MQAKRSKPLPDLEPSAAAVRVVAMNYLARREHGAEELIHKLTARDIPNVLARSVVKQLSDENLQSDERYVEAWVRSRINKGKGPRVIRSELNQRQIDESLIDRGIRQSEQDWFELALQVRQRKFGEEPTADFTEKAKQNRFLQSRGFESDQIRYALEA